MNICRSLVKAFGVRRHRLCLERISPSMCNKGIVLGETLLTGEMEEWERVVWRTLLDMERFDYRAGEED